MHYFEISLGLSAVPPSAEILMLGPRVITGRTERPELSPFPLEHVKPRQERALVEFVVRSIARKPNSAVFSLHLAKRDASQ